MASLLPGLSRFVEAFVLSPWSKGSRSFAGGLLSGLSPYQNPLPRTLHLKLTEDDLIGKRVFVVGDVHGCFDELTELLSIANAISSSVQVVFVGDLINKGPRSRECVELAQRIGALSVRGNNDEYVLAQYLRSVRLQSTPQRHISFMTCLSQNSLVWLTNLPYTISLPWLNVVFVHAGFLPGIPLEQQPLTEMIELRNVVPGPLIDAQSPEGARNEDSKHIDRSVPWASVWQGPQHVYFGHDARRGLQKEKFATGLDTGCVYGGSLSGLYLDEPDRIFSVKAKGGQR